MCCCALRPNPSLKRTDAPKRIKPGRGNGHRLLNETSEVVVYLEVGDRSPGDEALYPDDDLKAVLVDGKWTFQHKDGTPY